MIWRAHRHKNHYCLLYSLFLLTIEDHSGFRVGKSEDICLHLQTNSSITLYCRNDYIMGLLLETLCYDILEDTEKVVEYKVE